MSMGAERPSEIRKKHITYPAVQFPEHAAVGSPAEFPYNPAGQLVQLGALAVLYVPMEHWRGCGVRGRVEHELTAMQCDTSQLFMAHQAL